MVIDGDIENFFILLFSIAVATIYFSLSVPSLIEFLTGEKTVRERLTELESRVTLLEIKGKINHSIVYN